MTERIQVIPEAPEACELLPALNGSADRSAADTRLDKQLVELVKIRTSMLNGCVFCIDMRTHDSRTVLRHRLDRHGLQRLQPVECVQPNSTAADADGGLCDGDT